MAGDDVEVTARLRQHLEDEYGMRDAAYLMERPEGGWDSLATKEHIDLRFGVVDARFSALEERILREMERRFRIQTIFLVTALLVGLGLLGVLVR